MIRLDRSVAEGRFHRGNLLWHREQAFIVPGSLGQMPPAAGNDPGIRTAFLLASRSKGLGKIQPHSARLDVLKAGNGVCPQSTSDKAALVSNVREVEVGLP